MLTLLLFGLASMGQLATNEKGPDKTDFESAQAARIHTLAGVGDNGMVHCYKFRNYRAKATSDPAVYQISYREYRSAGPWIRMKAVLRRDGDEWIWVEGDPPKCSITIFETEEK